MRRFLLVVIAAAVPLGLASAPVTVAATSRAIPTGTVITRGPLGLTCEFMHDSTDSLDYWLCGGLNSSDAGRTWGPNGPTTPSWDGVPPNRPATRLDVDVTLPAGALDRHGHTTGTTYPLLAMLHGWGGNKGEWESQAVANSSPEQSNYNNVAFVKRGYAVLNYTARGHHGSCGASSPTITDPNCQYGWTHLADQRFEIRDTQFLAGELADAGVVDPAHIGVTGLSYGAGQSWELAVEASRVAKVPDASNFSTYNNATFGVWVSPRHHYPMHLAVAVPHYGWSDLINSLLPNGRASDGVLLANGDRAVPPGVEKASFVSALFTGEGSTALHYEPAPNCTPTTSPACDPSGDLENWFVDIAKGEPYNPSTDPILGEAYAQIKNWKSAYYLDTLVAADRANGSETPVLVEQGWTDQLFPEVEATSMINKLKSVDPNWPVGLALSDVGHPAAANKANDWSWLNARGNAFLDHYMLPGAPGTVSFDAQAQVTTCGGNGGGPIVTASSFDALHDGTTSFSSTTPRNTTALADTSLSGGLLSDPIFQYAQHHQQGGCITLTPSQTFPAAQSWTFPVSSSFLLMGAPVVHLNVTVTSPNAEIDMRFWDVAPNGYRTLVTRGVYRWDQAAGTADVSTQLQGNAWQFQCGHQLQLEVAQNDAPYLRPDTYPVAAAITYNSMSLDVPTHGTSSTCGAVSGQQGSSSNAADNNALPFTRGVAEQMPVLPIALALAGLLLLVGSGGWLLRRRRLA